MDETTSTILPQKRPKALTGRFINSISVDAAADMVW